MTFTRRVGGAGPGSAVAPWTVFAFALPLLAAPGAGAEEPGVIPQAAFSGDTVTARAVVVQPGAPGEGSRTLPRGGDWAARDLPHTVDDVEFMQLMILHHAQALEMTALVPERAQREEVRTLARRIEASQVDEIAMMQRWLELRDEEAPRIQLREAEADYQGAHHHDVHEHGQRHHAGAHAGMHGMLTPEQMEELAEASGAQFDRLFLEFMIHHHEGAIFMVRDLFRSPAGGQDGEVFRLASHVESDQKMEIDRMRRMLEGAR